MVDLLAEIEALLPPAPEDEEAPRAVAEGRRRALHLIEAAAGAPEVEWLALLSFSARALVAVLPGRTPSDEELERLTVALAEATRISAPVLRAELAREALRLLAQSDLPPRLAVESALSILLALAPVSEASLWVRRESTECVLLLGGDRPTRRMCAAARAALAGVGDRDAGRRASVHAIPVLRWGRSVGALVVRARPAGRLQALSLAEEAAGAIGPALEKEVQLERVAERERGLVQAGERRLTRLGFDIHDGPLQDIAALAADLRHFRGQLDVAARAFGERDLLIARLDDFEARLAELDRDLRNLALSLEAPEAAGRPLDETLRRYGDLLARRGGMSVAVDVRGDFQALTASQRLVLVRVVQEALTNIREHSGARSVSVRVSAGRRHSEAVVTDDGRGFNVERTLVRAAERGRLGLVGMAERVRLLGGRLDIESSPGGPTTVVATIPRWEPLASARHSRLAAAS